MSPKTRKNDKKRGFSLAETVIALSLITIVFGMTVSSVLVISSTYKKMENLRFFVNEINNYLECYKMGGAEKFSDNVNAYLLDGELKLTPDGAASYECIVCYDGDFNKTGVLFSSGRLTDEYKGKGRFYVHITINGSFYARVFDDDGAAVYSAPKEYYSRYDL
ncbi:MAG: type II secretion system protein [Clostridia bacterium]|nr:type II secretion system protein [Clostridia bacterium]